MQIRTGKLARLRPPPGVLRQRIGQRGRDENPPPRYANSLAPGYRRGRPLRLRAGGLQRLATLAAPPLSGTRRAALLGSCARAAPLGAIRPRRCSRVAY